MSTSKSETDIILNKANVALARSQRLVASWLPAPTTDDQANSKKTEEELQREEDEIFTAVPETYDTFFLFSFLFFISLSVPSMRLYGVSSDRRGLATNNN